MKQAAWPVPWSKLMADDDVSRGGAPERTIRGMMFSSNMDFRPLGVTLPAISEDLELKPSFIQILPKFSAMPKEDPWRHVQDFEMVCGTVRVEGQKAECIHLISFPLSLHDGARDWFYTLPKGSVKTWGAMQQKFLKRYYPASRMLDEKRKIYALEMGTTESLYDYWGRFKHMLAKGPLHQLPEQHLIQSFVCGLRAYERRLINAACGGSTLNKLPSEAFKILAEMAKASPSAPSPNSLAQEEEINELPKILKVEEHPPSMKVVDFEDNSGQTEDDALPMVKIQDECNQVIQRIWTEYKTLSKEVPKAPKAEVKIHQSSLPLQAPTMSIENETLPSPKSTIEEEGKPQAHLGQGKNATGCTLPNIKRKVVPAKDPQMKLYLIKKLLAFVIVCLTSCCQWKNPVYTLPKTSDIRVIQNKPMPITFQDSWGVPKGCRNFIWKPGEQDVKDYGHDAYESLAQGKEMMEMMDDQSIRVEIFRKRKELMPMKFQDGWGVSKDRQNFVWEPGGQDMEDYGHDAYMMQK